MKKIISILKSSCAFLFLIVLTFSASWIGHLFANQENLTWYATLQKPFFSPPSWLFGLVWPILYFLMSCAGWLIWKTRGFLSFPLSWYYFQLAVNAAYMPLFFHYKALFSSTLCIVFLLLLIAQTIRQFFTVNKYAGLLLIPYFLWCCFALNLSFFIWILNK